MASFQINRPTLWQRIKRQKWILLMLMPLLALTIIFSYLPLTGWVMIFTDYNIGDLLFGNEWTVGGIATTSVSLLLLVVVNKTVKKLSATGIF